MIEIVPKLFYPVDTGEKGTHTKIVIVPDEGEPGEVYYITRVQIINLTRHLLVRLLNEL